MFGRHCFEQKLGIPMDTNYAPLLADMLLYSPASWSDLHLDIDSEGHLRTKLCDKVMTKNLNYAVFVFLK